MPRDYEKQIEERLRSISQHKARVESVAARVSELITGVQDSLRSAGAYFECGVRGKETKELDYPFGFELIWRKSSDGKWRLYAQDLQRSLEGQQAEHELQERVERLPVAKKAAAVRALPDLLGVLEVIMAKQGDDLERSIQFVSQREGQ